MLLNCVEVIFIVNVKNKNMAVAQIIDMVFCISMEIWHSSIFIFLWNKLFFTVKNKNTVP
jgi:hypothetical protein